MDQFDVQEFLDATTFHVCFQFHERAGFFYHAAYGMFVIDLLKVKQPIRWCTGVWGLLTGLFIHLSIKIGCAVIG